VTAVHRSNLSKLGADGLAILRADGKIPKGPDFTEPDLQGALLDFTVPANEDWIPARAVVAGRNNTSPLGHCWQCNRMWRATSWAHCAGCCETFSSVSLFDRHRVAALTEGDPCLRPNEIMTAGQRAMFLDESVGIWRGPPKTEDALRQLRGDDDD